MTYLKTLLFILILSYSNLSISEPAKPNSGLVKTKVYNGVDAVLDDAPWIVAIYPSGASPLEVITCAGTIISPNWILTAAHCVHNKYTGSKYKISDLSIGIESVSLSELNRVQIKAIFMYDDNYNSTNPWQNDLALIQTKFPLKPKPVSLGIIDNESPAGWYLRVVGWGETKTKELSPILQKDDLQFVDQGKCEQIPEYQKKLTDNLFCAGSPGADTCKGDSGGPIFKVSTNGQLIQYGITSAGIGCGKVPGIYTKITPSYKQWIENTLQSTGDDCHQPPC